MSHHRADGTRCQESIVKQGSTEEQQPIFRLPTTIPSEIQSLTLRLKNALRSDPKDLTIATTPSLYPFACALSRKLRSPALGSSVGE